MHPGLPSTEAKLHRAQEHLNVLDDEIKAYLKQDPYRLAIQEYTHGYAAPRYGITLQVTQMPPDGYWGPLIGDAVHNLRSALDHLAWQFGTPEARQNTPGRIEFPIFLDDPAQDPNIRGAFTKKVQCLRPDAHAVVNAAQPYHSGDRHHPLWLLHRLWNTDKHRMLHTVGFLFGVPDDAAPYGFGSLAFGRFEPAINIPPFRDREPFQPAHRGDGAYGNAPLSGPEWESREGAERQMHAYERMAFDVSLGGSGTATVDEPYTGLPIRQVLVAIQRYITTEVVAPLYPLA